jgi:hypothetical protein
MITMTRPTRKKAHHIPALKIVSIAPQPLNTKRVKNRVKTKDDIFMSCFLIIKKPTIIPFYNLLGKGKNNYVRATIAVFF